MQIDDFVCSRSRNANTDDYAVPQSTHFIRCAIADTTSLNSHSPNSISYGFWSNITIILWSLNFTFSSEISDLRMTFRFPWTRETSSPLN